MRKLGITGSKRKVLFFCLAAVIFLCLASSYSTNKKRNKILLIGLDGAGWNVMMPIIEEGKLPNIKGLIDNGCYGRMETLVPITSEVIWTAIATGRIPDANGITANLVKDPDTGELIPPTSNLRKVKAIWNILSEYKKKVGVVGYRVSWPAERVNGVIISERAYGRNYLKRGYSVPAFARLCTENDFNSFKKIKNSVISLIDAYSVNILSRDSFMYNFSKYLLEKEKFDFFCIYLRGVDELSHHYWKYMYHEFQEISPQGPPKYKDVIQDYYIWCDNAIGELLRGIDKDTTIIIVSDHGFKTKVFIKEGRYIFSRVDSLLEACGLNKFDYNFKTVIFKNTQENIWEGRKNIKIIGELSDEEFSVVRENAKKILKNIKATETGQPIFKTATDTNAGFELEVDKGYVSKVSPGHHILINGREYNFLDFFISDPDSGDHDETDAIIIMFGKNIRQHQHLEDASVYDITPTVLYLLGLPVATDMTGKVLVSAINEDLLSKKPVRYVDTYEKNKRPLSQKPIRSPEDEKIIKERMRSLGYIN